MMDVREAAVLDACLPDPVHVYDIAGRCIFCRAVYYDVHLIPELRGCTAVVVKGEDR